MKIHIKNIIIFIGMQLLILLVLQTTLQQYAIEGSSMVPALEEGQHIFVNKVTYTLKTPERGDIIIFYPPRDVNLPGPLVKRIIGLPGETIRINSGIVYIDDSPLEEPYIKDPPGYNHRFLPIPNGHYFVLGDNRNLSTDSHNGWLVPARNIVGKAWVSVWPPQAWGLATNYVYSKN